MILLSAHKDVVKYPFKFSYSNGKFEGLLDNIAGVLMVSSLMEDENIERAEKEEKVKLFFGEGEEWGSAHDFPKLDKKKDVIVVVDVASGSRYNNYNFMLENISGFKKTEINKILDFLKWEGFKTNASMYNGNPALEDETWKWIEKGFRTISFCIPISGEWHTEQCSLTIEKYRKCKHGLTRLLNYLL